jgi:hypothetical protein
MEKKGLGNKKVWLILLCILIVTYLSIKFTIGFPIIYESTFHVDSIPNSSFEIGDTIHLLKDKKIDQIYLWMVSDDYNELPSLYTPSKLKSISDEAIINEIIMNFNFVYTGGDISTCESKILFFNNGMLVFKSNFLMSSGKFGLQNKYGWIESVNHEALFHLFNKATIVYKPIKFL